MPAKTVVVFDGLCALCQQSVKTIRRLDWLHAFEYQDAQAWDEVNRRFPQLDRDAILGEIHVVTPDGGLYAGYGGMRRIIKRLPLVMWLYPLLFLPGITWVGPKAYRWIADHRYQFNRLLGSPVTCDNGYCKARPRQANDT